MHNSEQDMLKLRGKEAARQLVLLDKPPEWANYVAQDSDGLWYWFTIKPKRGEYNWLIANRPLSFSEMAPYGTFADALFWTEHLFRIERDNSGYAVKFSQVTSEAEQTDTPKAASELIEDLKEAQSHFEGLAKVMGDIIKKLED